MAGSERREAIRKATLGKARPRVSRIVTLDGEDIEVRQPSVRGRSDIMAAGGAVPTPGGKVEAINMAAMQAAAIIECCFVPGTDERVFDEADREMLLEAPPGVFDDLAVTAMDLMNVTQGEAVKNSEGTQPDDSSSSSLAS